MTIPKNHSDPIGYVWYRIVKIIFQIFRYELLFGVTTADATFALNNRQLEYGLEPEERNRILSDFVSSNYGMHQREIFAAIGILRWYTGDEKKPNWDIL